MKARIVFKIPELYVPVDIENFEQTTIQTGESIEQIREKFLEENSSYVSPEIISIEII